MVFFFKKTCRADFLNEIDWEGHPTCKINLVNLYLELKPASYPPFEGNDKGQKAITHNNTLP